MTDGNIVARMIADHLNGRLPGLVGPGDRRWSYAFVEDVAEGHALALEKGRAGRPLRARRRERDARAALRARAGDRGRRRRRACTSPTPSPRPSGGRSGCGPS